VQQHRSKLRGVCCCWCPAYVLCGHKLVHVCSVFGTNDLLQCW
jgi:hypothetical protein